MEKFRFALTINDGQEIAVNPSYDAGALAYEKSVANGEQYFRTKLKGDLTFYDGEFDIINNSAFDSLFVVTLRYQVVGGSWVPFLSGEFVKTDAKFDVDAKRVTVSLSERDLYNDIVGGIDKTFNLIPLAPATTQCKVSKRGLVQTYVANDEVAGGFLGSNYYEERVVEATSDHRKLKDDYHFALPHILADIEIKWAGTPFTDGRYSGKLLSQPSFPNSYLGNLHPQTPNGFFIEFLVQWDNQNRTFSFIRIKNASTGAVVSEKDYFIESRTNYIAQLSGGETAEVWTFRTYTRVLTDAMSGLGINTIELPQDDIVENNRNYRRVAQVKIESIFAHKGITTTPTQWGRVSNTQYYFTKPYILGNPTILPVARSQWMNYISTMGFAARAVSLWYMFDATTQIASEAFTKQYVLRDTYTITEVIKKLLAEIAPNIQHEATAEYSEFLYGGRLGNGLTLLLTPKSNVLTGEYDTPAQRGDISLREVLNILRDIYRCYWYIEDGKLKIETIDYFMNGNSYSPIGGIGADLTTMGVIGVAGKKWSDRTGQYEFEKISIPDQITFQWADKATEGFTAMPIDVISRIKERGKIENVNAPVSTDIDLMLLQPSSFSPDGWALIAAQNFSGQYEIPITTLYVGDVAFSLQNPYLSPIHFQPNYWKYDLPASQVKINGEIFEPVGKRRNKIQKVEFPSNFGFDVQKSVKTSIGVGKIEEFSLNLQSGMAEAKLRHDTE